MSNKMERIFRDRLLTAEEISQDQNLRDQLEREFPNSSANTDRSSSLSETLKQAIRESDRSVDQLATDSGISPVLIAHFLSGERDIHMSTADRLADALGMKLLTD